MHGKREKREKREAFYGRWSDGIHYPEFVSDPDFEEKWKWTGGQGRD